MLVPKILLLLTSVTLAVGQEPVALTEADLDKAPLVRVEEVVSHPEQYDGLIIRADVLWINGYHGAVVCPVGDEHQCIGVRLGCADSERCKKFYNVVDKKLKADPSGEIWDKRARVSVVGRFKDTREQGRNSPRFLLQVLKIEDVSSKRSR